MYYYIYNSTYKYDRNNLYNYILISQLHLRDQLSEKIIANN